MCECMRHIYQLTIMNEYIYDMPYGIHLALQRILDVRDQWKELAKHIGTFKQEDIELIDLEALRPGQSPTNHLLLRWGQLNPTVKDLFFHLKAMRHDRALNVLRGFVPDRFFHESAHQNSDSEYSLKSVQDDLGLPLPSEKHIYINAQRTNSQEGEPLSTPVPPYNLKLHIWKNDPNRHPTQTNFSSSSFSDQCGDPCAKPSNPNHGSLHDVVPKFTYNELCKATDNFSEKNLIGDGGFGIVYYGELNRLRQEVAIKKLKKKDGHELEAIFRCRHTNIIQLLGFCETDNVYCLVYDYMKNGSLLDRLLCKNNTPPLTWFTRMKILFGASKGIYYLHSFENPIIHGDIKSANILLDRNFEAKIADFGLAKQADSGQFTRMTHVSQRNMRVYGSKDYLPDDYLEDTSQLRKEVDTFSFGIVMFETCFGVKAGNVKEILKGQFTKLKDLVDEYRQMRDYKFFESKLKDPKCQNWPSQFWTEIIRIGFTCTARSKKQRPSMDKVVDELEKLMDSAEIIQQKEQVSFSAITGYSSDKGLQHSNMIADEPEEMTIIDGKKVTLKQKHCSHDCQQEMTDDIQREKNELQQKAMKEFEHTEPCILAKYYDQVNKEQPVSVVNQHEDQINVPRVGAQPSIEMPSYEKWLDSKQLLYQQKSSNSNGITVTKTAEGIDSELTNAHISVGINDIDSSNKCMYLPANTDKSTSDILREKKKKKLPNLPPGFATITNLQPPAGQPPDISHQPKSFGPVEHAQSESVSDNLEISEISYDMEQFHV